MYKAIIFLFFLLIFPNSVFGITDSVWIGENSDDLKDEIKQENSIKYKKSNQPYVQLNQTLQRIDKNKLIFKVSKIENYKIYKMELKPCEKIRIFFDITTNIFDELVFNIYIHYRFIEKL